MEQQSSTDQLGLSNSQSTSTSEVQEREIIFIKGTPYNITRMKKSERWKIAMGNQMISRKKFKKTWMAKMYIASKPIELIVNTAVIISLKNQKA